MGPNEVLAKVRERDIRFIRLVFTDIMGFPKCVTITSQELEGALENGSGFDGSSVEGFTRIHESDMIAMPDPSTFRVLPWNDGAEEALMFCDILEPSGAHYAGDPRHVLRRTLARASERGWSFRVGPEIEYFYFTGIKDPGPLDVAGYFDLMSRDLGEAIRRKTMLNLDSLGIPIECSHHEVAISQHEIDLKYGDAMEVADSVMLSKLAIKEVAQREGVYATFMPKPIYGENGSGMHVHQSLSADGRNVFYDANDESHLSATARAYVEGLLRYAPEFTLITNQWVNSYKRLVPGFEAPVYISWARMNRSTLVRVPRYRPGHEAATRVELRSPDTACNPYLAFAVMLAAGLKGVDEGLTLREHIEEDIFSMTPEDREARGISMLPGDLSEAIAVAKTSEFLSDTLGEEMLTKLLRNKTASWDEYRGIVTPYEMEHDFPLL